MAGEWMKRKIGSLGRVVTGKTPSTADPANFGGHYPFITIPDLDGRVFISRTERTLSEKGAETIRASLLPAGSVMMSCIATVGRCGITTRPSFTNQQINSVVPHDGVDSRLLYYVFTQLGHELESAGGGGSVYTNVSKSRFADIDVVIPKDIAEQRAIAHILGTLDDKIELNRRMSETLEAMARALFKSWFVDFDPVRAKAEGRDPGLAQPLADLFPDSFEDSELGEIPKGWAVGCVGDEFDLTMGQSPPGHTYNEVGDGLPFYQGRTDFGFRFPTRRVYCTAPTRLAKKGDTLISVRAPVGDINMATEDCAIGRGVAAARHKTGSRSYSYQFMRAQADAFDRFEAEGTVFGSIGKKDFHAIACVVPPRGLVAEFERRVAPLDSRIEVTDHESRTLAALRDALLPKLISGELRLPAALRNRAAQAGIKDAERFLKERGL
ncbi:MAG: restriction endonuclease subunit S [Chloroflexi bacterium]|nr:restriction endonuclease subunit S [Chloroflexota bacterium]